MGHIGLHGARASFEPHPRTGRQGVGPGLGLGLELLPPPDERLQRIVPAAPEVTKSAIAWADLGLGLGLGLGLAGRRTPRNRRRLRPRHTLPRA